MNHKIELKSLYHSTFLLLESEMLIHSEIKSSTLARSTVEIFKMSGKRTRMDLEKWVQSEGTGKMGGPKIRYSDCGVYMSQAS